MTLDTAMDSQIWHQKQKQQWPKTTDKLISSNLKTCVHQRAFPTMWNNLDNVQKTVAGENICKSISDKSLVFRILFNL